MRIINFKQSYERFFSDKLVGSLSLVILFLTASALFQACKKDSTKVNLTSNAREFTAIFGPQAQQKLINANESSTFVFFCTKGSNVVAQLNTPDGSNTVRSYTDSMPIGVEGKYISFSIKDGSYYLAVQETTITGNQNITLTLS